METIEEKDFLKKISEGDKPSFGFLYGLYFERLFYFALHYLNDEENSKDVVQDVFSEVWKSRYKLKKIDNLSAWLFTLTKHICLKKIDHLKVVRKHTDALKYRQLTIIQDALNALDTSPMIFDELDAIVKKTLEELSPQCKKVFELSRFKNKKNKEIASELGISLKAVEAHITKSLRIFRKALKNYLPFILFLLR